MDSVGLIGIGLKQIILAIGIGVLCSLLIPLVYNLIPLFFEDTDISLVQASEQPFLILLFGVLTAVFTEELLFRAYPMERLKEVFNNDLPGIVLGVIVFCLMHVNTWNFAHVLGTVFPLGLILSIAYSKTRNLIFIMLVHFMVDVPLLII